MILKEILSSFDISQKELDRLLAILAYLEVGEVLKTGIGSIKKVDDCTIEIKSDLSRISDQVMSLIGREIVENDRPGGVS